MASVDLVFGGAYTPPSANQVDLVFGTSAAAPVIVEGVFAAIIPAAAFKGLGGAVRQGAFHAAAGSPVFDAAGVHIHAAHFPAHAQAFFVASGSSVKTGFLAAVSRPAFYGAGIGLPKIKRGPAASLSIRCQDGVGVWGALRIKGQPVAAVRQTLNVSVGAGQARFQRLAAPLWYARPVYQRLDILPQAMPARLGGSAGIRYRSKMDVAELSLDVAGIAAGIAGTRLDIRDHHIIQSSRTLRGLYQDGIRAGNSFGWHVPAGVVRGMRLLIRVCMGRYPGPARWERRISPPPAQPQRGDPNLLFIEPLSPDRLTLIFGKKRGAQRYVQTLRFRIMYDSASLVRLSDGHPIPVTALSVSLAQPAFVWSLSAKLADDADLGLVAPLEDGPVEVRATLNGHEFDFVVEDPESQATFGEGDGDVHGRSLGAYLDDLKLVSTWMNAEARTAQQLALDVLPYGVPLTWELEDWLVAEGAWSFRGTPLQALRRIAEAAGGVVASADKGQGFTLSPLYPVRPWLWGDATPWAQIPRSYFDARGERWVTKPKYNRVWVVGERGGIVSPVTRSGTSGSIEAPQISEPLATDVTLARQRGIAVLADTGRQRMMTIRMPVGDEIGPIRPGKLLEFANDGGVNWRGLSRSLALTAELAGDGVVDVMQTIEVERHG